MTCMPTNHFFLVFLLWVMYISIISRFDNAILSKLIQTKPFKHSRAIISSRPQFSTFQTAILNATSDISLVFLLCVSTGWEQCHRCLTADFSHVVVHLATWDQSMTSFIKKAYICSNWVMPQKITTIFSLCQHIIVSTLSLNLYHVILVPPSPIFPTMFSSPVPTADPGVDRASVPCQPPLRRSDSDGSIETPEVTTPVSLLLRQPEIKIGLQKFCLMSWPMILFLMWLLMASGGSEILQQL